MCFCAYRLPIELVSQSVSLPGYLCTVAFIDRVGLSPLQRIGFAATAFFFFLLAICQPYLISVSLIVFVGWKLSS